MTKTEWDPIVESAILESGRNLRLFSSACDQASTVCYATLEDVKTGKWVNVRVDGGPGSTPDSIKAEILTQLRPN